MATVKKKKAAAAKKPSKPKGASREYTFDGDRTVVASNVDRVVYAESGITKGDVLDYYRDIAPLAVPHLRGRAISIERYTKGVDKGGFFQKHYQSHFPEWVERFEMQGKTVVTFPMVNDAAALVYIANQGGFAFHIGTDRKEHPDCPDQIVFDLDPPEGRFDLAKQAAQAVRVLMNEIGLVPFIKTTGSKGLHVVVPVDAKATYEQVHGFLKVAAARLCERHPDLLTMEFYKKDRKGRLFLDVMRNGLGATVVGAYSLRGKPNAPISAPIEWDELDDPNLRPDGFTLKAFAPRMASDPWAKLYDAAGSVDAAMAKLT